MDKRSSKVKFSPFCVICFFFKRSSQRTGSARAMRRSSHFLLYSYKLSDMTSDDATNKKLKKKIVCKASLMLGKGM